MTQSPAITRKRSGTAAAMLLVGTVSVLALPSAVLAFSSGYGIAPQLAASDPASGSFIPAVVDPRLSRSITVRALSKGRMFRFTPAATVSGIDRAVVTVAVRVNDGSSASLVLRRPVAAAVIPVGAEVPIAPTAYSLGAARGYRSFAQNAAPAAPAAPVRQLDAPDLASFKPRPGVTRDPSRFAPQVALDEPEKTGRSPRTFEQGDQQVDLGGSYRLTRNLKVTAGVRYSSDRDRLRPLTDGRQDSQAVYVGTQFRF